MTEQIITACRKEQNTGAIIRALGFGFALLAVIAACWVCFFSKMPIVIENPAILVFASLFTLLPFKKRPSIRQLQKMVVFYLICVPINELSLQYFQFSRIGVSASYSIVVLSLCAIGYLFETAKLNNVTPEVEKTNILYGWGLAFAVIVVNMAPVALMLNKFYGYGYDRDLSVLGNMSLYFLLFIFLWGRLENIRFRQTLSLILALFFSVVIITKGLR